MLGVVDCKVTSFCHWQVDLRPSLGSHFACLKIEAVDQLSEVSCSTSML